MQNLPKQSSRHTAALQLAEETMMCAGTHFVTWVAEIKDKRVAAVSVFKEADSVWLFRESQNANVQKHNILYFMKWKSLRSAIISKETEHL